MRYAIRKKLCSLGLLIIFLASIVAAVYLVFKP